MKCNACGVEITENAAFCPACGTKVGAAPTAPEAMAAEAGLRSSSRRDDPEEELWSGGYSGKAMFGSFVGAILGSIALVILSLITPPPGFLICLAVMTVLWGWVLGILLIRRLNISYRLTSQRFFHQTGILTRTTNRIEVIEMDDVTYTQTFFERFFGVGTIKITSSDSTHPLLIMTGIADVQRVAEVIDKARRKEISRRGLRIESV
jgi:uncharacterized membrane protein YdbT with pleckstrin-like domain